MSVVDQIKEDHKLIVKIMDKCTHDIATEVDFLYLNPYLHSIFPTTTLQRAKGRDRSSYDIMTKICHSACSLSMSDFLQFLAAIRKDYEHVYNHINTYYREVTGHNLPNYENAPDLSQTEPVLQNSPSIAQNVPLLPQNASLPQHNASIPPQNAPLPHHNASIPPQNAPLPHHNASIPPLNAFRDAEPLEPNMSAAGYMNVLNPHELGTPETFHSSHSVSGSPAETTESSIFSRHINYVSLGPAVPCPSDHLSPPDISVSFGSSKQLSRDFLESSHNSVGVSTLEALSPDRFNPPSCGDVVPPGAAVCQREISSQKTKYNKLITENPNNLYTMESRPRGHCLIINNENFKNLSPRKGSSKDLNNLDRMFNFLGFHVVSCENKTATEMKILLEEFANLPALNQTSSLAVVVLSHGGPNDIIYGEDGALIGNSPVSGTFITKQQLQKVFSGTNCPSMKGKPKLFILQACRGDEEDDLDRSSSNNLGESGDGYESNYCRDDISLDHTGESETVSDDPSPGHRAETADMCFLHSSSLGYKAYRSKIEGSPFIQLFTKLIFQHAHEKSLYSIVMMLQNEFSNKEITSTKMTMPEYSSSLTRKWYFNPPHGRSSLNNFGTDK